MTPGGSGYTSGAHTAPSETGTEQHGVASPASASSSAASYTHRTQSLSATGRSPGLSMSAARRMSMDQRGLSGNLGSDQLRGGQTYIPLGVSSALSASGNPAWVPQQHVPQYGSLGLGRQPAWDLAAYLPDSPAPMTATPGSSHGLHHTQYYRNPSSGVPGAGSASQDASHELGGQQYGFFDSGTGIAGASQRQSEA